MVVPNTGPVIGFIISFVIKSIISSVVSAITSSGVFSVTSPDCNWLSFLTYVCTN